MPMSKGYGASSGKNITLLKKGGTVDGPSKAPKGKGDKVKASLGVASKGAPKSGTKEFSKRGAPAGLNWKNPNGR